MTTPIEIQHKFEANTQAVSMFLDVFEEWAERHEVLPSVYLPLRLILDEWLTNVASHAYDGTAGPVEVSIRGAPPYCIKVIVRDWGKAFDPFGVAPPDTQLNIEEREIGGLGIHFIRRMATELHYDRIGICNLMSIVKSGVAE